MFKLRQSRSQSWRSSRRFRTLPLEPLEARALLAVGDELSDGVLRIGADDQGRLYKEFNGETIYYSIAPEFHGEEVSTITIGGQIDAQAIDFEGYDRSKFKATQLFEFTNGPWVDLRGALRIVEETLGPGWADKLGIADRQQYLMVGDWREPLTSGGLAQQLTGAGWSNATKLVESIVDQITNGALVYSIALVDPSGPDRLAFFNGKIHLGSEPSMQDELVATPFSGGEGDPPPLPSLAIMDLADTEPDLTSKNFTFEVLTATSPQSNITFDWHTVDGSATTNDGDYQPTTVTGVTMPAGVSQKFLTVIVHDEQVAEPDENFQVVITNLFNAQPIKTTAVGTILDMPTVRLGSQVVYESSPNVQLTASLSLPAASNVVVTWETQQASTEHFARQGSDYNYSRGTVTFAPGEQVKTLTTIQINNDMTPEFDEVFNVLLLDASQNALIDDADDYRSVTIVDDDPNVTDLVAVAVSESRISVSWTDWAADEADFELQRRTDTSLWGTIAFLPADDTYYSDTDLPAGVYYYRVRARNASGLSSYAATTTPVILGNHAPLLEHIPDQIGAVNEEITFTAVAVDEDLGQSLTFSIDDGPAGTAITPGGVFTWTPTAVGTAMVTIRVFDDGSPSAFTLQAVRLVVVDPTTINLPPQINAPIGSTTVKPGELLSLILPATDPNNEGLEATPQARQRLKFEIADGPVGAYVTSSGILSWLVPSGQLAGDYPVTVKVTDDGTPRLSDTLVVSVHVGVAGSAVELVAPALDPSSDTGEPDDGITSYPLPVFVGVAPVGGSVHLFLDGEELETQEVIDGTYSIALTTPLAGGDYIVQVAYEDSAGYGVKSPPFDLTIVSGAQVPSPPQPVPNERDPNGWVLTDTPTFVGTAESGSTVEILDENNLSIGSAVAEAGTYVVTVSQLGNGVHNLTARAINGAGIQSSESGPTQITIDNTPATAVVDMDLHAASDSGIEGDRVTNDSTPAFTATVDAGSLVQLVVDGTAIGDPVAGSGTVSVTSTELVDGLHTVLLEVTNARNQFVYSNSVVVRIDTAIVTPSTPVVTNTAALDERVFSGTAEAGSVVEFFSGGSSLGTTVTSAGGEYSRLISLANGTYNVSAKSDDQAGNLSGESDAVEVVVDDSVSTSAIAPHLEQGAGVSLVNTSTLTIVGSAPRGTIAVYDQSDLETPLATSVSLGGLFRATTGALSDGAYTIVVKSTDSLGVTTVLSAGFAVVIDATAPSTPNAPALNIGLTGGSTTANSTNVSSPTFSGMAPTGELVEILVDGVVMGTAIATAGNSYAVQVRELIDDTHEVRARIVDAAGNVSASSSALTITVAHGGLVASLLGAASAAEGQTVTLSAVFSDSNTGTHTYDWQVTGNVSQVTGSNTDTFSFVPDESGNYLVTLTVTNDQNVSSSTSLLLSADNVPGQFENLIALLHNAGGAATLSGAIVPGGALDDYNLFVTWGDGTEEQFHYDAGQTTVSLSHAYPAGTTTAVGYPISLVLQDSNGQQTMTTLNTLSDFVWPEMPSPFGGPQTPLPSSAPDNLVLPTFAGPTINSTYFENLVRAPGSTYQTRVQEINAQFQSRITAINSADLAPKLLAAERQRQEGYAKALQLYNDLLDWNQNPNPYLLPYLPSGATDRWEAEDALWQSYWDQYYAINQQYAGDYNALNNPPSGPSNAKVDLAVARDLAQSALGIEYNRIGQQIQTWDQQQSQRAIIARENARIAANQEYINTYIELKRNQLRKIAKVELERNIALAKAARDRDILAANLMLERANTQAAAFPSDWSNYQVALATLGVTRATNIANARRDQAIADAQSAYDEQLILAEYRSVNSSNADWARGYIKSSELAKINARRVIDKLASTDLFNETIAEAYRTRLDALSSARGEFAKAYYPIVATYNSTATAAFNQYVQGQITFNAYQDTLRAAARDRDKAIANLRFGGFLAETTQIVNTYQHALNAADAERAIANLELDLIAEQARNAIEQKSYSYDVSKLNTVSDYYRVPAERDWTKAKADHLYTYEVAVAAANKTYAIAAMEQFATFQGNSLDAYTSAMAGWATTQNTLSAVLLADRAAIEVQKVKDDTQDALEMLRNVSTGTAKADYDLAVSQADAKRDYTKDLADASLQLYYDLTGAKSNSLSDGDDPIHTISSALRDYNTQIIEANYLLRNREADATKVQRDAANVALHEYLLKEYDAKYEEAIGNTPPTAFQVLEPDREALDAAMTDSMRTRMDALINARHIWEIARISAQSELLNDLRLHQTEIVQAHYEQAMDYATGQADAVRTYEWTLADLEAERGADEALAERIWNNSIAGAQKTYIVQLQVNQNAYDADILDSQITFDRNSSDEYALLVQGWADGEQTPHSEYLTDMALIDGNYQDTIATYRTQLGGQMATRALTRATNVANADLTLAQNLNSEAYNATIDILSAEESREQSLATARRNETEAAAQAEAKHTYSIAMAQLGYDALVNYANTQYQTEVAQAYRIWSETYADLIEINGFYQWWGWDTSIVDPTLLQAATEVREDAVTAADHKRVIRVGDAAMHRAELSGIADLQFVDSAFNAQLDFAMDSGAANDLFMQTVANRLETEVQNEWGYRSTHDTAVTGFNYTYDISVAYDEYNNWFAQDPANVALAGQQAAAQISFQQAIAAENAQLVSEFSDSQDTPHALFMSGYAGAYATWLSNTGSYYGQQVEDLAAVEANRRYQEHQLARAAQFLSAFHERDLQLGVTTPNGTFTGLIEAAKVYDLAEVSAEGARMQAYQSEVNARELALTQANASFAHDYVAAMNKYSRDALQADIDFDVWWATKPSPSDPDYNQHFSDWDNAQDAARYQLQSDVDTAAVTWGDGTSTANAQHTIGQIAADGIRWQAATSNELDYLSTKSAIQTELTKRRNNDYTTEWIAALGSNITREDSSAQAISGFVRETHHQEKLVLDALYSQLGTSWAQFFAQRADAQYTWDQSNPDPLLAIRHDLAVGDVAAETARLTAQKNNANAIADLQQQQLLGLVPEIELAIGDLVTAQNDYVSGALNAAADYQVARLEYTRDNNAGMSTPTLQQLLQQYSQTFITGTEGPRREMADAVKTASISIAALERDIQTGTALFNGIGDLNETLALAVNPQDYGQEDARLDALYDLDLAGAIGRNEVLTTLYGQLQTPLVEADLNAADDYNLYYTSGQGYADYAAAIAAVAAELTTANSDASSARVAYEAQAAADYTVALDAATELYDTTIGDIDADVLQGLNYQAPWTPAVLDPFTAAGYVPSAATLMSTRIDFVPKPTSLVHRLTDNYGSYYTPYAYYSLRYGGFGDYLYWGGDGGYGGYWGFGAGFSVDGYFGGYYNPGLAYLSPYYSYAYWGGFGGEWNYYSDYYYAGQFYSDFLFNATQATFDKPPTELTQDTFGIGQNQFNVWGAGGSSGMNIDDLVGFQPADARDDLLVPDEAQLPNYWYWYYPGYYGSDIPLLPGIIGEPQVAQSVPPEHPENDLGDFKDVSRQRILTYMAGSQLEESPIPAPPDGEPDLTDAEAMELQAPRLRKQAEQEAFIAKLDEPARSNYFWDGAITFSRDKELPSHILHVTKYAKVPVLPVPPGGNPGYRPWWNTMYLSGKVINELARVGASGDTESTTVVLGDIYNESFHAWYAIDKGVQRWYRAIVDSQRQYRVANRMFYDSAGEEAASELVNQIIESLSAGEPMPEYSDIINSPTWNPNSEWYKKWYRNITPQHPNRFEEDADKPMNETLYYATFWVLYNLGKDPMTSRPRVPDPSTQTIYEVVPPVIHYGSNVPGQLAALKQWWATKFRPNWTPQQVKAFAGQ